VGTKAQKQNIFRPHLQLSPSINPSQNVATVVRLPVSSPEPTISLPTPSQLQSIITSSPHKSSSTIFIGSPEVHNSEHHNDIGIKHSTDTTNGLSRLTLPVESRSNNQLEILSADQSFDSARRAPATSPPPVTNFKKTDSSSGPNPGQDADNFPIISLIDEPSAVASYYDTVLHLNIGQNNQQEIASSSSSAFKSSPTVAPFVSNNPLSFKSSPVFNSGFNSNPNIFSSNQNSLNANPYYAPEEFTYNQDPILIDHSDNDEDSFKEIVQDLNDDDSEVTEVKPVQNKIISETEASFNEINDVTERILIKPKPTLLPTFFEEIKQISKKTDKAARSLASKDVFRKRVKPKEVSANFVKTIEYKPSDIKKPEVSSRNDTNLLAFITPLVKCNEFDQVGYCKESNAYAQKMLDDLLDNCKDIVSSFQAFIPENIDELGDNSESVISSEKDHDRPWSWTVSAYKKKQVCESDLAFIRPSYALDTKGQPQIIIQSSSIQQRVSVDICRNPGSPCPGLGGSCGDLRSLCVQRYQHQYLMSIPDTGHSGKCPVITAVRLPSGCVCHAQTQHLDYDIGFGDRLV